MGTCKSQPKPVRTPLQILQDKYGRKPFRHARQILKKANFDLKGTFDLRAWEEFENQHTNWINKNGFQAEILLWKDASRYFSLNPSEVLATTEVKHESDSNDEHGSTVMISTDTLQPAHSPCPPSPLHPLPAPLSSAGPSASPQSPQPSQSLYGDLRSQLHDIEQEQKDLIKSSPEPDPICSVCHKSTDHPKTTSKMCSFCISARNENLHVFTHAMDKNLPPPYSSPQADPSAPCVQDPDHLSPFHCSSDSPLQVLPNMTQTTNKGGNENPRVTTWYKPWSQSEQLTMVKGLPDPHKQPGCFVIDIERIQQNYSATWDDLEGLVCLAQGRPLYNQIRDMAEENRDQKEPQTVEAKRAAKSGEWFIKKLRLWGTEKAATSMGGLLYLKQERDETSSKFHGRLQQAFHDQGFDTVQEKDRWIFANFFLNGLREDLKTKLMEIRPECVITPMEQNLIVLRGIEEQLQKAKEKREKKEASKQIPVIVNVTAPSGSQATLENSKRYVQVNNKSTDNSHAGVGLTRQQCEDKNICYYCKKAGHLITNCEKLNQKIALEKAASVQVAEISSD